MKKITFAILAIAFIAAFNSCNGTEEIQTPEEDDWEYVVKQYDETTPHTPGTFVMFGANTYFKNGVEETRTKYAEEYPNGDIIINNKKYERIDWIAGDMIQIFCNQSSSALDAEYDINAATIKTDDIHEEQSVAAVTLKSGEQGLKWGTDNPHIFHGIYPSEGTITDVGLQYPQVTNRVQNGPGYSGQALKFITTIPTTQPYPVDMRLAGMVATTKAQLSEAGNVTMIFYPIVTTLQFDLKNVSKSDITIKKIYIYAPKDLEGEEIDITGKYDVTVSDNPEVAPVFQCDPQKGYLTVNNINQTLPVSEPNKTVRVVMFALPEVFTGAKLAITMMINGQEVTRMIALNEKKTVTVTNEDNTTTTSTVKEDIVFQPTHKYNFTIKIPDSTVFEVKEDKDFDVPGGIAPITVTSYTYDKDGVKTPLAWTATRFSIDGKDVGDENKQWSPFNENALKRDAYGNLPTLLEEVTEGGWSIFSTVGDENKQAVTQFNAVVAYNKPPYRKLKEATPAVNVDLSLVDVNGVPYDDNKMNTANCYMVHARGTYKFPMVYGNAIKNGNTNWVAFRPTINRTTGEINDSITKTPYGVALNTAEYYNLSNEELKNKYYELGDTQERHQLLNVGWGSGWSMDSTPFSSHFLSPFVDHAGIGITSPWITTQTNTTPQAKLIWQDSKGLIKDVHAEGDYVTFTVVSDKDKDDMTPEEWNSLVEGNALIAVYVGADILWSWHIWITEMTEEDNISVTCAATTYAGQTVQSTMMGKKLIDNVVEGDTGGSKIGAFVGFCDLSVAKREIVIEFVQEGNDIPQYVTLTQKGRFDGNAPIYQNGRKDPLQFQNNLYEGRAIDKPFYNDTDNPVTMATSIDGGFGSGATMISNGIKNPNAFCVNSIVDGKYYNLWAARNTRPGRYEAFRADRTKTIYDPCPAGYRVPALADVAAISGNNGSDAGHVAIRNNDPHFVILLPGSDRVYVPLMAGKMKDTGEYGSWTYQGGWQVWEGASWVSTPGCFSNVATKITETYNGTTYTYVAKETVRYSEDFYWSHKGNCNSRWKVAGREFHQIRFTKRNSWMNENGGSRANAVNIFMIKETSTDTSMDKLDGAELYTIPSTPSTPTP